jgi:membrane-associated phospholipid phosphatase
VAAAVFVVAVGVAVIADGGHWPSDVLAGWCLAVAWVVSLRAAAGDPLGHSATRIAQLDPGSSPVNARAAGPV